MAKNNSKETALGGNYKLKGIKVFVSKENLYRNAKKYRKVFDELECRYIYCELSIYNKLFDEIDWDTSITFRCKEKKTEKVLCEVKKDLKITKEQNIVYVNEGWGTPAMGWWKKGSYYWEVTLDDKVIGTADFYLINGGPVTSEKNPYFEIQEVKLFESAREGLPMKERVYLRKFAASFTRYINVEMTLKKLLPKEDTFPLELKFYFYNDSGQKKAYMHFFKEFENTEAIFKMDTGYGANKTGYWFEDIYFLEIIFMDQLIAVCSI